MVYVYKKDYWKEIHPEWKFHKTFNSVEEAKNYIDRIKTENYFYDFKIEL